MNFSILDNALWAAGFFGHVALVLILILKKRARDYPVFTSLLCFEALTTITLFLVSRHGNTHAYKVVFWATAFVDYIFQVALIFEIARDVLRPTGTWVRDARTSFLGWGGACLLIAAALAMQIGPPESKGLDLWDVRVTVFTSLLTCGLFLAMSAAANRLGLQRRNHIVYLGQGIAAWGFSTLIEQFGHVIFGWKRHFVAFDHFQDFVYVAVLVFWMVVFWLPEKARAPLSPEMSAYLVALHRRVQYDLTSVNGPPL